MSISDDLAAFFIKVLTDVLGRPPTFEEMVEAIERDAVAHASHEFRRKAHAWFKR